MRNHVHLVIETSEGGTISKIMQGITLSHTRYFNRRYDRVGHVWQGRFKSPVIEKEGYLLECGRYVELNPARAELVKAPGEYEWSSYRFHAHGESNDLLDEHPLYAMFGRTQDEREKDYRKFIEDGAPEETVEQISESITSGSPLGANRFTQAVQDQFDSKRRNRRKGRPKKSYT